MGLKFVTKTAKSNSYGNKRDYSDIRYIVVHFTGNKGDTALDNATYFATSNTRSAGAHVFVDGSGVVYKSVPINRVAWSVGGFFTQANGAGSMYKKATNANTLNIEMCNCANGVPQDVFDDTAELTRYYMKKYDVPASHVLRHWDVNGKSCPAPWASKGSTGWSNFKKVIQGQVVSSSGSASSGSATSSSGTAVNYKAKINTASGVNVRKGAGTGYRIVTAIPNKTTVTITKESGSWGYTSYGGKKGWICLNYTTKVTSGSSGPSYKVGSTYTLQADALRVRTGAGTNYAAKTYSQLTSNAKKHAYSNGCLKKGTEVTCKQVKNVGDDIWMKIPSGWIAAYYNKKTYVK